MGRLDENRFVQQIFPVAGKFLLGDDPRFNRFAEAVAEHDGVADLGACGIAQIDRRYAKWTKCLHQPEATLLINGQRMRMSVPG